MGKYIFIVLLFIFQGGCIRTPPAPALIDPTSTMPAAVDTVTMPPPDTAMVLPPSETPVPPTATVTVTPSPTQTPNPPSPEREAARVKADIPAFDHILIILFENHDYNEVIGNQDMPVFNRLAQQYSLLTNYYAVAHPSLPNYIALIGGDTFGINSDCADCFVNQPSLPDLIEASGRSWKTYQEDMPGPCHVGFTGQYDLNHNPFLYFDPIRKDSVRCDRSVVPLTDLKQDLNAKQLPNYAFIMPDLCHSGHDCSLAEADAWLGNMVSNLQDSSALGKNYLLFVLFDENSADQSPKNPTCCGAGGRVAAVVVSPQAKTGFQDTTALSHYSLLRTILLSWGLPRLGLSEDPGTKPISAVWK